MIPTPRKPVRTALLAAVLVASALPAAADDAPPVGTVRTLPVVSLSLNVGSTEKETKRVVYAPPPGWYIRSHQVECRRVGPSSYTVNTVPAGWQWASDEAAADTSRTAAAATVSTHQVNFGGTASLESDAAGLGRQRAAASHHALVVEATARGPGLWRGNGGIDLTVVAEMVYVGPAGK